MDIKQRIKSLEDDKLHRLLFLLNYGLEGSVTRAKVVVRLVTGAFPSEAGAFDLLAAVESLAIQEQRKREAEVTQ